jgi:hypothetical protein
VDAPLLEQRIANALCSEISSAEVEALIGETETRAAAAEEAAAEARVRALDPTVLDPSARAAATDAEFVRDRLRAALPKLQTRLAELGKAEAYARWIVEYDRVKPLRDALAEELRELYPDFVGRLTDLLRRIQAVDAEASRVSYARPIDAPNDGRRLRSVELEARDMEGFALYDLSILRDLKLPSWEQREKLVWPPPAAPLMMMPANFSLPVVGTPEMVAERERLRHEESERVIAHYRERDQQRTEREEREARANLNGQVAERNRNASWG